MTFRSFFKLFFGIVFVLLLLGALLVYLNYSMSNIKSTSATLLSDTYTVGTDSSGTVSKQYVVEGQEVTTGDKLFDIRSSATPVTEGTTPAVVMDTTKKNDIQTLRATGDGTMLAIDSLEGSFVPANKEIATITKADSLYVEASYKLSPPDYARVKIGDLVTVTLPNTQKVQAKIFDIQIDSDEKQVRTVIKARVQGLGQRSAFKTGTPVSTVLHLNGKTLYDTVSEQFQRITQPKS